MLVNTRKAATEDINAAKISYFQAVDLVSSYVQNSNPSSNCQKSDYEDNLKQVSISSFQHFMGLEIPAGKKNGGKLLARLSCKLTIFD